MWDDFGGCLLQNYLGPGHLVRCYELAVKQLVDGNGGTPLWMYYAPWQRMRGVEDVGRGWKGLAVGLG